MKARTDTVIGRRLGMATSQALRSMLLLTLSAGFASTVFATNAAGQHTGDPKEREAVLATLESWTRGWAQKDAALAVRDYAEDVDWTNAFGDRFEGKRALLEGLEFIFGLDFVMAGDSGAEEYADVRFLGDEVALVRSKLVRAGQRRSSGETMPDRHINHLRVLEKREGRWWIVSHLISQAQEKR